MGYVYNDGSKLDMGKEKVLQQAEDKLVKARDLLKQCRAVLLGGTVMESHSELVAKIYDFIGD